MLAFIRKWLTSWPVLALLGLVLIAFVITGVGDPFGRGGKAGGDLATVGRTGIGEAAVLKRFERVVAQAREGNPSLTQAEAARQGAVEQVVDNLADAAALEAYGKAHGIVVSDRAVDGAIASIDAFRVGGKFDQATYQRLLAQQRLSERELRDGIRADLVRRQLLVPVSAGAGVPREVALPYARLLLDVHEGFGATVPPPPVPAPTPAQVAAYYADHKARFVAPERRAFRYALLDRAAVAAKVTVSDADARAEYDKNLEAYGAAPQRKLSQLVLADEGKAKAFADAVRGGQDFAAAAARANGASAADVALGLLTQPRYAAATSKALAAQVFAAKPGSVIGPVKTDFGYNVVRIDGVVEPKGKEFATLKPTIVAKLRDQRTETAMAALVARIEDGLQGGASFADEVKQQGLTAVDVPPVGKDGSGANLPPAVLPVVAKAFDADPADGPVVVPGDKGEFALIEVGRIVSPAPPPLAEINAQVTAALTQELRAKAAQAVADRVVAAVAKGTPFAAALAAEHLPPAKPIKLRRLDAVQQKSVPPAVLAFLTMTAGTTRALPAADGTVVLLRADAVRPGDIATAAPLVAATRQQLTRAAPEELAAAFARAVDREVGVKLNPAAIAATKARILGDAGQPK